MVDYSKWGKIEVSVMKSEGSLFDFNSIIVCRFQMTRTKLIQTLTRQVFSAGVTKPVSRRKKS